MQPGLSAMRLILKRASRQYSSAVSSTTSAFLPAAAAREIRYSPEVKTAMVLKAKDTISSGRLEYDAGHTDITQSFMAIRKTMTASGNRSTYEASRSEDASHADVAWAIMHALLNEPLTAASGGANPSILEFY